MNYIYCRCGHYVREHLLWLQSDGFRTKCQHLGCLCTKLGPPAVENPVMNEDLTKPTNPKDIIAINKLPLNVVPSTLGIYAALGHLEGAVKYGRFNWRVAGISISVYLDALKRHVMCFENGEWEDPHSRVPHLANAIACLSILVDAIENNGAVDDRPPAAGTGETIRELPGLVKEIRDCAEKAAGGRPVAQNTISEESVLGLKQRRQLEPKEDGGPIPT